MMADSIDRVFVHALNTVKRLPRTGSARPPDGDRLRLYGLYKQSTEGDVEGTVAEPSRQNAAEGDGISEIEKWQSWKSNAGLSKAEAKKLYITTLIDIMHRYATTTSESRELAAELEFVWNQIKSSPDSPASSAAQVKASQSRGQSPAAQCSIRGSLPADRDGLRVLRPFRDTNDEDRDALNSDTEIDDELINEELQKMQLSEAKSSRSRATASRPIERALARMTVEVAALREQMEAANLGTRRLRSRAGVWTLLVVKAVIGHVLVDMALLAFVLLWARRSRDPLVSQSYHLLISWLQNKSRRLRRLPWP